MSQHLILANIEKHITLTQEEKKHFFTLVQSESYKKNDLILRQGELCRYIYFVNSGILRAHLNTEGKDATVMFALKDWWITDMYCFLNELPSMVNIQVVKECHVWKLSKQNLDLLFTDIPNFERFFRILMQNAYCREQLRVIQNLPLSARERYEHFLNKYPQIAREITLKQIASYLGITPEFLSVLRAQKG